VIFLFTLTTKYYQPDIALAAVILFACCLGFLAFNWYPAKIFLGEGGSLLLGYLLGVLAIISGAKIAIALLVMGIPLLDVIWTVVRRLKQGVNPFKFSDQNHLHHKFLKLGLGQRKTVIIFCCLSAVFGVSGLFLQTKGKILALGVLLLVMIAMVAGLDYYLNKKFSKKI
jgi:UDP-N-acetylmuramyl pentapeptide phosphotransferase/UDP-N-acetylglucosamine-1-phosphate transferase